MKKSIVLLVLLYSSNCFAGAVPDWADAREVMEKCYSGWDVKITLAGGARETYTRDSFSELSTSGEFSGAEYSSLSSQNTDGESVVRENLTTDLEDVSNAYQGELEQDRFSTSAYVGVTLSVPLYDRTTRIARREKSQSAVHALSDLYAKFEGYRATVASIETEQGVVKQIMMDGGEKAITAYYNLLAEKEKARALMNSARRKIFVTLEGCGYVERDRASRKR